MGRYVEEFEDEEGDAGEQGERSRKRRTARGNGPGAADGRRQGLRSILCEQRSLTQLKRATSPLAQRILRLLVQRPGYSHELAKRLQVHEQKVYYHVRKLEAAGLIREERRADVNGASAKYYEAVAPAFSVLLTEMRPSARIQALPRTHERFLAPFIEEGKQEFLIVIGSPDAHGPRMTRAKDGGYAIDLALFLGSHLVERPTPAVKLDTELREEDLRNNLIVIGGPIVNTLAARINAKLPIRFKEDGKTIVSTLTKTTYDSDEIGLIVAAANPFAPGKRLLFIAGRRGAGTKAAIIAFLRRFDELIAGNRNDPTAMARVVEGKDMDSDGLVDDVSFKE